MCILLQSQSLLITPPPFFPLSRCGRGSCFGGGLEVSCSIPARSKGLCPSQLDTECKCVRVHVHTYIRMYVCAYVQYTHACRDWFCLVLGVCSLFSYVCACTLEWSALCVYLCCLERVHACIVHTCMYNTWPLRTVHTYMYVCSFHPLFNPLPLPLPLPRDAALPRDKQATHWTLVQSVAPSLMDAA